MQWWRDARFGMFIHWGPYSSYGGEYKGSTYRGYSEHIMLGLKLMPEEYRREFSEKFDPVNFDADGWVRVAKATGMKYMVITAKHHDGFALFHSDAYPYDIRLSKYKGDPIKELADACRRQGMRFGFYYSQANDWEHPDASGRQWSKDPNDVDYVAEGGGNQACWDAHPEVLPRLQKYVNEKAIPQITELIEKYKPDLMWFDTPGHLPASLNARIGKAVRALDPTIVINGRLGADPEIKDYENTADCAAFFLPHYDYDWEAIPTTNESYAYKVSDNLHKPPIHFVRLLASAAARGGNVLMNIGPKGDGTIDERDLRILRAVGAWADVHSESIYGTQKSPIARQCWGEVTRKGDILYLHVFKWPIGGTLMVGGLGADVKHAYLLGDPKRADLATEKVGDDLSITIPADPPDTMDSVIVLETSGAFGAASIPLVMSSGVSTDLMVFDSTVHGKGARFGCGTMGQQGLQNWTTSEQWLSWTFRINETATFDLSLSYNTQKDNQTGKVYLDVGQNKFEMEYSAFVPVIEKDEHGNLRPCHSTLVAGRVTLSPGTHNVRLTPGGYTGDVLMQPLSVTLTPCQGLTHK